MKKPYYRIWSRRTAESSPFDATSTFAPYLSRLQVYDNTAGKSDAIKLELADDGSIQSPEPGFLLDFEIGYEGGVSKAFNSFMVDQILQDGPPARLQFSATGAAFDTNARSPKERTHASAPDNPLTLRKLLARLAADNGADSYIAPDSLGDLELPLIDQAGQSDIALAYDVAETYGGVFKPTNGLWQILGYSLVRAAEPAITIRRGVDELTSWRAHFVARRVQRAVTAYYQDNRAARRVAVTVGSGDPATKLRKTFATAEIAKAHATARYYRSERKARQLELEMPGRPEVNTHSILAMDGFRDRVDGKWLVTSVVHELDKGGYRTRVEGEGIDDLEAVS